MASKRLKMLLGRFESLIKSEADLIGKTPIEILGFIMIDHFKDGFSSERIKYWGKNNE